MRGHKFHIEFEASGRRLLHFAPLVLVTFVPSALPSLILDRKLPRLPDRLAKHQTSN